MKATAGTPIELVQKVYGTLTERVAAGRTRFGRPLTLAEKILLNHLGDASEPIERGGTYNDFHPTESRCRTPPLRWRYCSS